MLGVHDKNSFKKHFINRILSLELNFDYKMFKKKLFKKLLFLNF
jgi:hypothetical protein